MSPQHSLYSQLLQGGIIVTAILAVTVLGYHGTLGGQAVVAVLSAAIGGAVGGGAAVGAVGQAVNGKATVSDATLRQAMASPGTAHYGGDPQPVETPPAPTP